MMLNFLIIFVIVEYCSCVVESDIELTASLTKRFGTGHCYFILKNLKSRATQNAVKTMSRKFIMSAVFLSEQQILRVTSIRKPLIVIETIDGPISKILNIQTFASQFRWLYITKDELTVPDYVYIPINSEFFRATKMQNNLYNLEVIYQIRNNTIPICQSFGTCSVNLAECEVPIDGPALRTNVFGTEMIISTRLKDYCSYQFVCLHVRLAQDFVIALNGTPKIVSDDELSEKYNNQADIIGNVGSFHSNNNDYLNLLAPTMQTTLNMYVADMYSKHDWASYTRSFANDLWFSILGFVVLSSLAIMWVHWMSEKRWIKSVLDLVMCPMDAMCNQGEVLVSGRFISRWSQILPRILAVVLYPAYSAAIISYITVAPTIIPFHDIFGFYADGTYKVGSLKIDSFTVNYFKISSDKKMQDIGSRMQIQEAHLLPTYADIINHMCENKKFVFAAYSNIVDNLWSPCRLLRIPTPLTLINTGLPLPLEAPFKPPLKISLLQYYSCGIKKRYETQLDIHQTKDKAEYTPITLDQAIVPFIILFCGTVAAALLLHVEMCYALRRRRSMNRHKGTHRRILVRINRDIEHLINATV